MFISCFSFPGNIILHGIYLCFMQISRDFLKSLFLFPIDFQVTWSKVRVKLLIFFLSVIYSISFDPLLDEHLLTLDIAFRVTMSNYWSSYQHCPLNILWIICLMITKLGTMVVTREWIIHCIYATILNFAPWGNPCIYVSQKFLVQNRLKSDWMCPRFKIWSRGSL